MTGSEILTDMAWEWDSETLCWQLPTARLRQGLLYGYGHYTSFVGLLSQEQWDRHWQRLMHDSAYLGLSLNAQDGCKLFAEIGELGLQGNYRFRLSHVPRVDSFVDIQNNACVEAGWLLTAQPMSSQPIPPVSVDLHIVPVQRRHAAVKHLHIADTIYERRRLKKAFPKLENAIDVAYSCLSGHKTILLEAGFANLFYLHPEQKLAVTTDPKHWPCLPGIQLEQVMAALAAKGWTTVWDCLCTEMLKEGGALFLSNAVQGVVPVQRLFDASASLLWQCDLVTPFDMDI